MPDATGAFTADDLAPLRSALASGALRVEFRDRTIEYRSIAEILAAIQYIETELSTVAGSVPVRQIRMYSRKGFGCGYDQFGGW